MRQISQMVDILIGAVEPIIFEFQSSRVTIRWLILCISWTSWELLVLFCMNLVLVWSPDVPQRKPTYSTSTGSLLLDVGDRCFQSGHLDGAGHFSNRDLRLENVKTWNKDEHRDVTAWHRYLDNSWDIITLIWRISIQNPNFVDKMFEVYVRFSSIEGMVMQLLASSKLVEVDQSVKDDRTLQNEWLRGRERWVLSFTAFNHFFREDRMLFQGAQKLFGTASRFKKNSRTLHCYHVN